MFASQNRARSVWQSLYLVLNSQKRVQFIKRPIVLLYKGYKSSVNYDGEPSVPNGIVYQLPSSHLLIHWVLAKLSNRVMPYGENYCKLQLLFVYWFYWPAHSAQGTDIPWTHYPASFSWSLWWCNTSVVLHRYRVSFQNPARFRNHPEPGKALE